MSVPIRIRRPAENGAVICRSPYDLPFARDILEPQPGQLPIPFGKTPAHQVSCSVNKYRRDGCRPRKTPVIQKKIRDHLFRKITDSATAIYMPWKTGVSPGDSKKARILPIKPRLASFVPLEEAEISRSRFFSAESLKSAPAMEI